MEGYLGEFTVDVNSHRTYRQWCRSEWCILFLQMYGQIDGDHHKAWVLDQIARILHGTPILMTVAKWKNGNTEERFCTGAPSKEYLAWVEEMKGPTDEDGDREYDYDEGIAP